MNLWCPIDFSEFIRACENLEILKAWAQIARGFFCYKFKTLILQLDILIMTLSVLFVNILRLLITPGKECLQPTVWLGIEKVLGSQFLHNTIKYCECLMRCCSGASSSSSVLFVLPSNLCNSKLCVFSIKNQRREHVLCSSRIIQQVILASYHSKQHKRKPNFHTISPPYKIRGKQLL